LEVAHDLAHERIRSALITGQHQEARGKGAQRAWIHAAWANQGQGSDAVWVFGRQAPPVSATTGCEVGALDPQVLEQLPEAFFYRQFYCCHHPPPHLLISHMTCRRHPITMASLLQIHLI